MNNATPTSAKKDLTGHRSAPYRSRMIARGIALATAILGLTILAPTSPAQAEPACYNTSDRVVSPEEYSQLQAGMSLPQVRDLVGASGVPMDPMSVSVAWGHMERSWKVCARPGWVLMRFEHVGQSWVFEFATARWS